jgi:hypothetical protein
MRRRLFLSLLPALLLHPFAIGSPSSPNFSGRWRQSSERSIPARTGDVILQIDHRDPDMTVETTILRSPTRHALQHYTTDGKIAISTGADGDEFHTSIVWRDQSLVFSIEEHEHGRIIHSRETWTLIENGTALERLRERSESQDGTGKQTIIYLREATNR